MQNDVVVPAVGAHKLLALAFMLDDARASCVFRPMAIGFAFLQVVSQPMLPFC